MKTGQKWPQSGSDAGHQLSFSLCGSRLSAFIFPGFELQCRQYTFVKLK